MDTENEKERVVQVQNSYAHVFNRTADPDHGEMRRLIESTMHVDSKLSANVQFADWVAVRDLHNSDIFARERPALAMSISQRLSPEDRIRMEEAKAGILAVARASGL